MREKKVRRSREQQKLKTRYKILSAARELMNSDQKISLEDVARLAGISRATMYRYFSNLDLLFSEAALDAEHKYPDQMYQEVKGKRMKDRILLIQDHYNRVAYENETAFRRYLSAVLSESVANHKGLRGGRRVSSLELALKPYRKDLGDTTFRRLVDSASILMGIDPIVTSRDVCNLNGEDSLQTLRWALEMVLAGVEATQQRSND